ncbi:MAG TPA: radical SAM protein, partial [Candidatus Obscuribacterales bacterium]
QTLRIGFYAAGKFEDAMIRMNGPAFGLAYMSAYLKQQFPGQIEEIFLTLDAEELIARKPDLVGISAFTYAYGEATDASERIRKALPQVPIIVGGPHISAIPVNLRRSMDIGVIGEGEVTMRELVRLHLANALTPQHLREVSGLIFWNDAGEQERSLCPDQRLGDLDMLPHPDRQLLKVNWRGEELSWLPSLSTARGCPFTCNFCMYSKSANLVRYHSLDWVMEEIRQIVNEHPTMTHLLISDDLFVTKKSRLKELAERIRAEKLHQRLTFGCMAKASFFDEEYAAILKDMNVASIAFGFESGSDTVLHYLKDKRSSVAKNQRALDLCHQYGIQVGGYFIIGSPDETPADMAKTYWFIRQNRVPMPLFGINLLMALPGTEVWQEAKQRGLIDENFNDWECFSYSGIDKQRYFFLNRQYSRDFYMDAYHKHFFKLKEQASDYLTLNSCYKTLQHHYLQELVLPQIRARFKPGSRLLVAHRGEASLLAALESDYQVSELRVDLNHSLPEAAADGEFDGVVLHHVLEYEGFDSQLWVEIGKRGLPLLLISENAATLARLGALLGGKGMPYNAPERTDVRHLYALPQLQARLALSHQIQQLERNRLPRLDTPFGEQIAQMADQALKPNVRDMGRLYAFPLL